MYRVTICSAYLNHHNKPIYDRLSLLTDLCFIATKHMKQERRDLGYNEYADTSYLIYADTLNEEARKAIDQADVFIYGTAPEEFIEYAYSQKKIILIQLERLFKQGAWKILDPRVYRRYYRKYLKEKDNPRVFYLCMSAYAGKDLSFLGVPQEKLKQWAYISAQTSKAPSQIKQPEEKMKILWVGRYIWWKRPQDAIRIAKLLNEKKYDFELRMIGTGKKVKKIEKLIEKYSLGNIVKMLGAMPPEQVYENMLESDLLLATSNRMEGWGVVVNEAMQHECVVIGSRSMGSVPVLIETEKTGYIYNVGNIKEAVEEIIGLQKNKSLMNDIKRAAKERMKSEFSIDKAVSTYLMIFESLCSKGKWPDVKGVLGSSSLKR